MIEEFNQFAQSIADRISQELKKTEERENVHRLGRELIKFGNMHPDKIATFRGPYKPSHHYDIHIVIPQDINRKQRKPYTMYGFDTGSGRYFSVEIPKKMLDSVFFREAAESRRKANTRTEWFDTISRNFQFQEVGKQDFVTALTDAVNDLEGTDARAVADALDLFPELPHLNKENFFGPESPPEGPQFMGS